MSSTYISSAFRSSGTNEAYIFIKNQYVLVDYAPGTTDDRVLDGPLSISEGFPSLSGTPFAETGIDCAFGSSNGTNEAYIFSGDLCVLFNYAPHTKDGRIITGPVKIIEMFPFLEGTVFETGVDAAFESTTPYEAYLFKGNQSARINYKGTGSVTSHSITEQFPSFKGTVFENGLDAAFASHRFNEAYVFKGDTYALIDFAPGTLNDYIINGPKLIRTEWPSLHVILPH